jgi:predicted DNA-binding transcriptional regulator YafY
VSRMLRLQLKDEVFISRSYDSLKDYISRYRDSMPPLQEMVVLMDTKTLRYTGDIKYQYGLIKQEDAGEKKRLTFLFPYPEFFGRWLLMFTDAVTVESPTSLKDIMVELVKELKGKYE